ncbi:cilia- and flagella-associated protein 418-like isoform X2 [Physella acuta]|nr:cilia- and flagella-associated protein 418-like isoform X2 [Physella acuta]XP_059160788.1 cilia- and flagella-associated protein 418-like isoform X2 [Physella acuta]XP_059160790.1 cilia- and flagella-associated protein 418-like isoform X2 [Physella acuta]XP_059160791.1 cilia- and flagella-associated protein 418-like isoform X2 [Physella acuta]XP_059160792.1 cilia- and flagella-associated protein 418-like isoform X2 [Physella acuta]
MDDIDDLLDEVETKFMNKKTASPENVHCTESTKAVKILKNKQDKKGNPLDDLIDDILDIDVDKNELHVCKDLIRSPLPNEGNKNDHARRCLPVFLGGSSDSIGLGSSANKRSCDQLRCTSCDFRVCFFDNLSWSKDTDYLFLRNNVPDLQKLKSRLIRKNGCRAYCCQCTWRNVTECEELSDPSLKWVCGKHS